MFCYLVFIQLLSFPDIDLSFISVAIYSLFFFFKGKGRDSRKLLAVNFEQITEPP